MSWDDDSLFADDPDEFGDDPFGDNITDDEVAEDAREDRLERLFERPGGGFGPRLVRPPSHHDKLEKMAAEALKDQGRLIFKKIATTKDGEVYEVVRRKGEAKTGLVQYKQQDWRFFPNLNFNFTAEELDEISDFLDEQV